MNRSTGSLPVILLVEDDDNDAFGMELAFRQANLSGRVRRVRDGQEAIDYLAGAGIYANRSAHPLPSLLLMDWHLPQKKGFEVLRWVRSHPTLAHLATVVLTSSEREADKKEAYALGANSYLLKPDNFVDFVQTLVLCEGYWRLNHVPKGIPASSQAAAAPEVA